MGSDFKIFWTNEALDNLDDIFDYLKNRWTQREIDKFRKRLSKQIDLIAQNPKLFPISLDNPRLHKAVLSRQTTIFYEVSGQIIYLVYLFSNKQDIEKIK
jgi:plasmid stabilization system protein ParE